MRHAIRWTTLVLGLAWSFAAGAAWITYDTVLDGPSEATPNASPGTGVGHIRLDVVAHVLGIDVTFAGLLGTTTASHIHCCTANPFAGAAGVATQVPTFVGFPLGVTSGSYQHLFDTSLASTWNAAFVTANGGTPLTAEAALAAGLASGKAYLNIHSTVFPSGEIRGFAVVPEPGTLLLMLAGVAGLAWRRFGASTRLA